VAPIALIGATRDALAAQFQQWGEKPFRVTQLMKWIYHEGCDDFAAMSNLSKALRAKLAAETTLQLPEVALDLPSRDGSRKWLLRLADGNHVEMVFIPEGERGTLCVSSQVGCTLACSFCSTARQGFNRNLASSEIIGQLLVAQRALGRPANRGERHITNVVLMGMGEPLLNFEAVVAATEVMQDDLAFGISKRRVTLSTAGVVPMIDRLHERSEISLAVSLHAPDDALRDELVPINRKYPIAELLAACRRYVADRPQRRVTFEYVMLAGVNDSEAQARQLLRLMRSVPSKINLIPFNPFPGAPWRCSDEATTLRFQNILINGGITTMVRKTRGDDIDAACGQLVGRVLDRTRRSDRWSLSNQSLPIEAS